ncbi:MAG TPA: hypothetical protein VKG24_25725 [Pseudolabrys sp.]|nr:hypothetical protein [Pseudolabrys sp.]
MLRNLHLSALRAFEAATRTGSFRLVADDLGLTFWTFPANLLAGAAAAAGIALINSVGKIGGFASTFVVGWLTDLTHSTSASLYLFAGLLVVSALLLLTIPAREINK